MSIPRQRSTIGLLLSGGIDSAVLLDQLLAGGRRVVPFYVRTGCVWDARELAAVRNFLSAVGQESLADLVVLDMPLDDMYADHWSITGTNVPDDSSPDDAVFIPGRNPLLLIKPVLWCQMHGIAELAIATLENNPFDDATPQFFDLFEQMMGKATGQGVQVVRPFEQLPKHRVIELGRHLPLELTFSCLSPRGEMHCGRCNKCAERRAGFRRTGAHDQTQYAAQACAKAARAS